MSMKLGPIVWAVIIIIFFGGCSIDEACLSNQNAAQAGFYSAWSVVDKDSLLTDVSVFGLDRTDSLYRKESLRELFLPLDFNRDTTAFVIAVKTLKDTLWMIHSKELDFISGNCGYFFSFELDTVMFTRAFIDSVAIGYPSVKYGESEQNIKLYIY